MKIVFFGSDSFVIPVIQNLEDNFEVIAVVTTKDSPISGHFKGLIFTSEKLNEDFTEELRNLEPELLVVASYGKIIPQSILDIPKFGALNIHPSLLPKFRGPSPVPATILNGDTETGVTIIKMDEKMDHGQIVFTKEIMLSEQEDTPTLINKLFQLGAEAIITIIPDFIAGKLKLIEQDHDKATFSKMMTKDSGFFEINTLPDPLKLDRMIRAYYPWPGVWTLWRNKIVKFLPGGQIQMEGKKVMPLQEFLKGYQDFPLQELTKQV